jgi:hypothetical protein
VFPGTSTVLVAAIRDIMSAEVRLAKNGTLARDIEICKRSNVWGKIGVAPLQ